MISSLPFMVATDFSAPARHATQRAGRLAQQCHTPLHLVHIIHDDFGHHLVKILGNHPSDAVEMAEASAALAQNVAQLEAAYSVQVESEIQKGNL
jgi:nucleotide-binding universal stress UspA family protein